MSLDRAIESGKEHRKKYNKSKAIAKSCRNHGNCEYCKMNRLHQYLKQEERTLQELEDYEEES